MEADSYATASSRPFGLPLPSYSDIFGLRRLVFGILQQVWWTDVSVGPCSGLESSETILGSTVSMSQLLGLYVAQENHMSSTLDTLLLIRCIDQILSRHRSAYAFLEKSKALNIAGGVSVLERLSDEVSTVTLAGGLSAGFSKRGAEEYSYPGLEKNDSRHPGYGTLLQKNVNKMPERA